MHRPPGGYSRPDTSRNKTHQGEQSHEHRPETSNPRDRPRLQSPSRYRSLHAAPPARFAGSTGCTGLERHVQRHGLLEHLGGSNGSASSNGAGPVQAREPSGPPGSARPAAPPRRGFAAGGQGGVSFGWLRERGIGHSGQVGVAGGGSGTATVATGLTPRPGSRVLQEDAWLRPRSGLGRLHDISAARLEEGRPQYSCTQY